MEAGRYRKRYLPLSQSREGKRPETVFNRAPGLKPAGKVTGPVGLMESGGLIARRSALDPKTPLLAGVLLQRISQLFGSSDFSFPPSPEQPWRIQVEMPNRGNSHPWTKNHTATTITNINRSFILPSLRIRLPRRVSLRLIAGPTV